MKKDIRIAVIGATGLVGRTILRVLEKRYPELKSENVILVASERTVEMGIPPSQVSEIPFLSDSHLRTLDQALMLSPDFVLMSAGATVSREWAPRFVEKGAFVIDNSSAWRTEKEIPLIVPGISDWKPSFENRLIANPNCVAIMIATAMKPIVMGMGLETAFIAVKQSVSGAGVKGIIALKEELQCGYKTPGSPFLQKIANNIIPAGIFEGENDYTNEELKGMFEVDKILKTRTRATFSSDRVPVEVGHSATVHLRFHDPQKPQRLIELFEKSHNVVLHRNDMNLLDSIGTSQCHVYGVRKDPNDPFALNFKCASDNLHLGAASNAVAIFQQIESSMAVQMSEN